MVVSVLPSVPTVSVNQPYLLALNTTLPAGSQLLNGR
jgi:hypothetical protein